MRAMETLLEEGLRTGGCPICHVGARNSFDLMAQIVGTIADDPETVALVGRANGLCNMHAWDFADIASATSINELYQALLQQAADRLETEGEASPPPRSCGVCDGIRAREVEAVRLLLARLQRPEGRAKYERTRGMCLPHLAAALHAEWGSGCAARAAAGSRAGRLPRPSCAGASNAGAWAGT